MSHTNTKDHIVIFHRLTYPQLATQQVVATALARHVITCWKRPIANIAEFLHYCKYRKSVSQILQISQMLKTPLQILQILTYMTEEVQAGRNPIANIADVANIADIANITDIANTVESQFNDLRFNDIPGITINIRFPGKSHSKMYGAEPQFNDIRFNDIPGLTMGILFPESKIFSAISYDKINMKDHRKCCFYNKTSFN